MRSTSYYKARIRMSSDIVLTEIFASDTAPTKVAVIKKYEISRFTIENSNFMNTRGFIQWTFNV